MMFWGVAILLASVDATSAEAAATPVQYAQVTIRQQIIVRVPARPRSGAPPARQVEWKESKGPKCIPAKSIAGATLRGRDEVDLILRNHSRIRAKLESSCPALDYYQGFYISPNPDGMVCEDRDVIRSRVGGSCEIERFRGLKPKLKD